MPTPSLPGGYGVTKHIQASRSDCHVTVGFDRDSARIPRFLVQLHYQVATDPVDWKVIARMDHNERSLLGHNVYREGLHVDVERRTKSTAHLQISHGSLPPSRGTVIRRCAEYLIREADYFIDVYKELRDPGGPPQWSPDGGERPHTLISANLLSGAMSEESPVEDALTLEELSEVLAKVEGTTPEAIERGAEELELAPPTEATVVDE